MKLKYFAVVAVLISLIMMTSGCVDTSIQGIDGPHLVFSNSNDGTAPQMTLDATFQDILDVEDTTAPIPRMPESTIEVSPDPQSKLHIQAVISLADITALTRQRTIPAQTLPGGRLIPDTNSGTLPGFAVPVPQLDSFEFYAGSHTFGVFVPLQLDSTQVVGTYPFYDDSGNHVGNLSVIGQDSSLRNSGFLLLLDLDSVLANRANTQ